MAGSDIDQDLTEGTIHPHSLNTWSPQSLIGAISLLGRELKQSLPESSSVNGVEVFTQAQAPYHLAFLNEAEARPVPRQLHLGGIWRMSTREGFSIRGVGQWCDRVRLG